MNKNNIDIWLFIFIASWSEMFYRVFSTTGIPVIGSHGHR